MSVETNMRTHTIDAAGKRLGIVATEAATVLQGKDQADYMPNVVTPVSVVIENASKLDITERRSQELFQRYSGYPGGRKVETLEHLAKRLGYGEVVRRVVNGMLPKNKLQKLMIKNLTVTE